MKEKTKNISKDAELGEIWKEKPTKRLFGRSRIKVVFKPKRVRVVKML
jgi:hypothetical protein